MFHAFVEYKNKNYTVTFSDHFAGHSITTTYDVSTRRSSARASYTRRTSWVNPDGRLGLAILRKAAERLLSNA